MLAVLLFSWSASAHVGRVAAASTPRTVIAAHVVGLRPLCRRRHARHVEYRACGRVQGREKLMSDLRGALAISNDVHAELMEAVRDGREPARVAAAAAARRAIVFPSLPHASLHGTVSAACRV